MKPEETTIRLATSEDADSITDIYLENAADHAALDPRAYSVPERDAALDDFSRRLEPVDPDETVPMDRMWVAEVDGEVAGYAEAELAVIGQGGMIRYRKSAHIGVAVGKQFRGHNIGERLIKTAESWAAACGAQAMSIDAHSANDGALRFYERVGYRPFGVILIHEVSPVSE